MARDREVAPTPSPERTSARPAPHVAHPVLALQQAAGNRATGRVLARAPSGDASPTIKFGKTKFPVSGGNIAEWAAGEVPTALIATSEKGDHSAELERRSAKDGKRIDSLTLTVAAPGKEGESLSQGSLAIEITNGKVQGYELDGSTESWRLVKFDGVHRTKVKRTVGQG